MALRFDEHPRLIWRARLPQGGDQRPDANSLYRLNDEDAERRATCVKLGCKSDEKRPSNG